MRAVYAPEHSLDAPARHRVRILIYMCGGASAMCQKKAGTWAGIERTPRALRELRKFAQQSSDFSAFPVSDCGAGLHQHPQTSGGFSSTLPCAKRKQAHVCLLSFGAGNGNRTRITSLGSWSFAIRLYLRIHIFYLKSDCLSTPKIIFLASYPIRVSPRIQRHCIKVSV